ncbi:MAG TPA: glycosyltransferase family 2 protein [bacterium]|nr:glycosyltransferase family 2 protein [bacterium]
MIKIYGSPVDMIYFVIPVYNESVSISRVIDGLARVCGSIDEDFHFITVDDGSSDGSATIISEHALNKNISLIKFEKNRGIGEVLRAGFAEAAGKAADEDPLVFIEADGSNDPETIARMMEIFRNGTDVISASRYMEGGACRGFPPVRAAISASANFLLRTCFRLPDTTDYTYFLKMYRASVVKKAFGSMGDSLITGSGFSANAEFFTKMCLFTDKYGQTPSIYRFLRADSDSKFDPFKEINEFRMLIGECRGAIRKRRV